MEVGSGVVLHRLMVSIISIVNGMIIDVEEISKNVC